MIKTQIEKKDRYCYFCNKKIDFIDYKDLQLLQRFISSYYKIVPRKRSGVCNTHQRKLSQALKRARFMGFLPFTK